MRTLNIIMMVFGLAMLCVAGFAMGGLGDAREVVALVGVGVIIVAIIIEAIMWARG